MGIAVGEPIETIAHHYPEIDVVLHFFDCRRVSGKPQPLGCVELRWVTPEQLPMYSFPEADAKLIKKLAGTQR